MTRLDYTKKTPSPAPTWIGIFQAAAFNEALDASTPSRRALLVATAILEDAGSREPYLHRFAVALDADPLRLYELERRVSPAAPIEQVEANLARRVELALRGLS